MRSQHRHQIIPFNLGVGFHVSFHQYSLNLGDRLITKVPKAVVLVLNIFISTLLPQDIIGHPHFLALRCGSDRTHN